MRWFAVLALTTACGRIAFDPLADSGGGPLDDTLRVYNRAFVTSQTHAVPWIGTTEASVRCRDAATAAGLDGNYLALLGDEAVRPQERLPISSARGWVDLAGAIIVDEPAEWVDGRMRRPLHLDEHGVSVGYQHLWLGARMGATCDNWNTPTASLPSIALTTNPFTLYYVVSDCTSMYRFVCVEYARNTPVVETAQPGRVAFVTTTAWSPGVGLSAADGLCAAEATSHDLTGSFKALLATSTAPALSRFSLTGPAWVRIDGLPFVDSAMDLANRPVFASFLLRSDGTPALYANAGWVWTGNATDNCVDWTTSVPSEVGATGDASSAERTQFFANPSYPCDGARPLVCLQE
jgi:hypothetical protein